MSILPLPGGVRRFALDEIAPEPWRNGGGWTRTVAALAQGDEVAWRVSAADITRAGPFSRFDGMERTAVMLRGERLELHGAAAPIVFTGPGQVERFGGELQLHAELPGTPVRLWNVMTRRGRARASVAVHRDETLDLAPDTTAVVFVLAGQYLLGSGKDALLQLEAGEGLCIDRAPTALELRPAYPGSRLIHTQLFTDLQGTP